MFGVELERMWGTRFFVKYYAITGIGAGVLTVLVSLLPFPATAHVFREITIGASGALYGLLLAFALYYPHRPILMFMLFPVPAKYFVMIIGAIAFLNSASGIRGSPIHAPRRPADRLSLPEGGPRRLHRGDQVSLLEVEDEPPSPEVRRLFRRTIGLGPSRALIAGSREKPTSARRL